MSDQQRGYAGWPAPTDPRRQPPPVNGPAHPPQDTHDEDPPWFDDGFVAYDAAADEVPWDRPADTAWPEPEADFGQWADDAADAFPSADPAPAANEPMRLPGSANRFGTPSSPVYPAPAAAPYAAPATPPYPTAFEAAADARQPERTTPYAAAGRPVYAPPVASAHNGNGRPAGDPPLRFGNRPAGPAQPTPSPAVPPTSPASNWEAPRFAPPQTFPPPPIAPPAPVTQPAPAKPSGTVDDVADPYDEFAPLANDLTPVAKPDEPAPAPVPPKWTPMAGAPSASVFGDLFGVSAPPMPHRESVQATPAQAAPAPTVAEPPAEPVEAAAFDPTPTPTPQPEAVDAPPADWPPVPTAFAPKPWESVSRLQTPWAAAQPTARATAASAPSPAAAQPEPPQQSPISTAPQFAAPRPVAPVQPAPPASAPPVHYSPQPFAAQPFTPQPRPAWRTQPAQPATATPAASFVPPMPQAQPIPPAGGEQPRASQPGAVLARHVAEMQSNSAASPQPALEAPAAPTRTIPVPADPTRASLAEHATPDELWFLAPQGQSGAQSAPFVDGSAEESEPSTMSTLFWTVMTGVFVVALVLAFLLFLTGVFR